MDRLAYAMTLPLNIRLKNTLKALIRLHLTNRHIVEVINRSTLPKVCSLMLENRHLSLFVFMSWPQNGRRMKRVRILMVRRIALAEYRLRHHTLPVRTVVRQKIIRLLHSSLLKLLLKKVEWIGVKRIRRLIRAIARKRIPYLNT